MALGINWGQAGSVILSGLVIVFLILIILIAAVELTSRLVKSAEKKTQAAAPAPVLAPPTVAAPAPFVQAGIEEETVAAISAAVYCCLENATGAGAPAYAIKSISRASGVRPVWGFAGMRENTRPF
jgi:sodium pump decarboxylase gamma subunit